VRRFEQEYDMSEIGEQRFEEALEELERVVARLEGEELSLDEAIALFKKGQVLLVQCQGQLESAELKVQELTLDNLD
jgi:exodeoxyribonuclease VII small subunit